MRSAMKFVALAATALLVATGCNVMRGEQSAGDYVDDATLTARVKAALMDDEQVKGTNFNVDVYQGKVTLSGVTDSRDQASRAQQIARQVPGVKGVDSTIRVSQAGTTDNDNDNDNDGSQ
jgi:hyperosmotically inducible periplasmic protein